MSARSHIILIGALAAVLCTTADQSKVRKCEVAAKFLNKGFTGQQIRFSVCYAQRNNFQSSLHFKKIGHEIQDKMYLYGMFPITEQWCSTECTVSNSVCGLHCDEMLDEDIENDLLCLKTIFRSKWHEPFLSYARQMEDSLHDCMETVLNDCCIRGPGGVTKDCVPIFDG